MNSKNKLPKKPNIKLFALSAAIIAIIFWWIFIYQKNGGPNLTNYPYYPWISDRWSCKLKTNQPPLCYSPSAGDALTYLNQQNGPFNHGGKPLYNTWSNCPIRSDTSTENNWADCNVNPNESCRASAYFNWIIGTCLNVTPIKDNTGGDVTIPTPRNGVTCDMNPNSTELIVNYVGTYQYVTHTGTFKAVEDSCFNLDKFYNPYNCRLRFGGNGNQITDKTAPNYAWLPGPWPGQSSNWKTGYYPAGTTGATAPAMMFILSVDRIYNAVFYALNQAILDRGPVSGFCKEVLQKQSHYPYANGPADPLDWSKTPIVPASGPYPTKQEMDTHITSEYRDIGYVPKYSDGTGYDFNNTWQCNSGEFDIIEPICSGTNWTDEQFTKGFSTLFSKYNNGQGGRCLFASEGCYKGRGETGADGSYGGGGSWMTSQKYFKMSPNKKTPRVIMCIVDKDGMKTYNIPTGPNHDNKYVPGISQYTAEKELTINFNPKDVNISPCEHTDELCGTFNPWCNQTDSTNFKEYKCAPLLNAMDGSGIRGFIKNWAMDNLVYVPNTRWGDNVQPKYSNTIQIGDWNVGMEGNWRSVPSVNYMCQGPLPG